jgi:hypothetical protein
MEEYRQTGRLNGSNKLQNLTQLKRRKREEKRTIKLTEKIFFYPTEELFKEIRTEKARKLV